MIEVVADNAYVSEPKIMLIPDEQIKRIIMTRQPKEVYDRIPPKLHQFIIAQKPIPLSNRVVDHIKHMPVPYGTYGTSLIRRLFTTLAYKTKIMTANWIVAERLIIPIRVVKIGSDDRPASSADIAEVNQMLAVAANDPNLTIVTHHNFNYDWIGASGKILQLSQELEHVDKDLLDGLMLNQALLNGEMSGYQCYDEETEVLTDQGFMKFENIINEEVKIANYDPVSSFMTYEKPLAVHEYDYDGDMICFEGKQVDIKVTPNHRMLVRDRKPNSWTTVFADEVKPGMRFLSHAKYAGEHQSVISIQDQTMDMRSFLSFVGYYVSEGFVSWNTKHRDYIVNIDQSPKVNPEKCKDIEKALSNLPYKYSVIQSKDKNRYKIHKKNLSEYMKETFGKTSQEKKIPSWIKNLSSDLLLVLLKSLNNGDGTERKNKNTTQYIYTTISKTLADDVQEIALKCNFHCTIVPEQYVEGKTFYKVRMSKGKWSKGHEPHIKKQHISRKHYKGKVWCFTTSTGFFVTRRNGKVTIQGNSAQVGVEVLIRRIESWRLSLGEWFEERVFRPIAQMKGLLDKEATEEFGQKVWLYPSLEWNDLNLKDKTQENQLYMQAHDKQIMSTQTLCEKIGLEYDKEVERMRYEMSVAGPMGAQLGGGGMGGMGGMPMGGGGISAPGGGAAPPDLGGMGGAPGGDMGGGMGGAPGGGAPGGAMAGAAPMKILKKSKAKAQQEQEEPMQFGQVKFTRIEQEVRKMLDNIVGGLNINTPYFFQYKVANPQGGQPYALDFAFPKLKMGIECDGAVWHSNPVQLQHDRERDSQLAMRGWTVLRFDDKTIEDKPDAVRNVIVSYLKKSAESKPKVASFSNLDGEAHYLTVVSENVIDIYHDELPDLIVKLAFIEEQLEE